MQSRNLILGACPCKTKTSTSQHALYMQAAVLLQFELHLKNSIAIGSEGEAKRPDMPNTPQSTGLAAVRTLGRCPDAIVTFAAALVPSLHDSMSILQAVCSRDQYLSAHDNRASCGRRQQYIRL